MDCFSLVSGKFVMDDSNYASPHCSHQHKENQNHLKWDRTLLFFPPQSRHASFLCVCLDNLLFPMLPQSYLYPNLSEGADSIGGQLCKDKVPLQWCNQFWQSLKKGARKRCLECDPHLSRPLKRGPHSLRLTYITGKDTAKARQRYSKGTAKTTNISYFRLPHFGWPERQNICQNPSVTQISN